MKKAMKVLPWICQGASGALCILALAGMCGASSAWSATLSVTTLDDSGPGSLRQAIDEASPGDTITFGIYGTITLTSGALTIDKDLEIAGPGPHYLRISGNHASRVFVIRPNRIVTLSGMTISDGLADGNSPLPSSVGGGILNGAGASLILSGVVMSGNQALGDAGKSPFPDYAGAAFGGGIANFGTLDVTTSSFIGNLARGADGNRGNSLVAGFVCGGGIYNNAKLTVIDGTFTQNQVVGGNNNSSVYLTGHASGGAIFGGGRFGDLFIRDSQFDHNQAIGGNGNVSTSPLVPAAVGPNVGSGGAIEIGRGTATCDSCTLEHNWSVGGAGASGADGGIGTGGAVVSADFNGPPIDVTISNSRVEHNMALGGPGSAGNDGGEGSGGGLTSIVDATLTVISTTVAHNHAQGGHGGEGGNGGNGLGGGLYDHYDYTSPPIPSAPTKLILQGAIVTKNLALSGEAGESGSGGQGIGGGVYYLGTFTFDAATVIEKNQATTGDDNVGP